MSQRVPQREPKCGDFHMYCNTPSWRLLASLGLHSEDCWPATSLRVPHTFSWKILHTMGRKGRPTWAHEYVSKKSIYNYQIMWRESNSVFHATCTQWKCLKQKKPTKTLNLDTSCFKEYTPWSKVWWCQKLRSSMINDQFWLMRWVWGSGKIFLFCICTNCPRLQFSDSTTKAKVFIKWHSTRSFVCWTSMKGVRNLAVFSLLNVSPSKRIVYPKPTN